MKTIVIYYSLEGSTDLAARSIADLTDADLIRLIPEKALPAGNFQKYFWGGKSAVFSEKPKLTNEKIDLSKYDTVVIGTPVWAGTFAPPILTFLTEQPFFGKNVYLFASHSGGGAAKCFAKLTGRLGANTVKGTVELLEPIKDKSGNFQIQIGAFCEKIMREEN